jgi:hypothetical protein
MKSRYIAMKESHMTNDKGDKYPDVLSFPIKEFVFNDPLKEVTITQRYKERFYLLCYESYGSSEYDDIVLWMNGISSVHILTPGETILLPSKRDLDRFLIKNKVDKE